MPNLAVYIFAIPIFLSGLVQRCIEHVTETANEAYDFVLETASQHPGVLPADIHTGYIIAVPVSLFLIAYMALLCVVVESNRKQRERRREAKAAKKNADEAKIIKKMPAEMPQTPSRDSTQTAPQEKPSRKVDSSDDSD
jgi:hypothetical protein